MHGSGASGTSHLPATGGGGNFGTTPMTLHRTTHPHIQIRRRLMWFGMILGSVVSVGALARHEAGS